MDVFFRSNDGGGGQRRSTVPADGRRYLSTVALEDRVYGWSTHHHLRGMLWAREFAGCESSSRRVCVEEICVGDT